MTTGNVEKPEGVNGTGTRPKAPYRKPEILSEERLEVVAVDCSADGKNPPGEGPFTPCAQQPQS